MKLKKIALGSLAALVVTGSVAWFSLDKETQGLLATLPTNRDLLFWSVPQRDAAFRALDRLSLLAKWREVPVYERTKLAPGNTIKGPALVIEDQTTIVITADFDAHVNSVGCLVLDQRRRK